MFDKQDLVKLATLTMPFGKYRRRLLIDDLSLDLLEQSRIKGRKGAKILIVRNSRSNCLHSPGHCISPQRFRPDFFGSDTAAALPGEDR